MPSTISIKQDPAAVKQIKVELQAQEIETVDYVKLTDTTTGERWYYYVMDNELPNGVVAYLAVMLDSFATVGLGNISFFGNISRRSLSKAESNNYQRLPEPWAPRRPLKSRRIILNMNVGKQAKIPSHIGTVFEQDSTSFTNQGEITVLTLPDTVMGRSGIEDGLSIEGEVPMLYPTAANASTTHTVSTPWGSESYETPYEDYMTISGTALSTFLRDAKKSNALDLISQPYWLPSPPTEQNITISEIAASGDRYIKSKKHYTTLTIRSLSTGQSRTFSDSDTNMQYNQPIVTVVVPDKNGGLYVLPKTIRDTGLNEYTYLEGVYSPFENIVYNAVGDTPGKFAADGTNQINEALNGLFGTYITKINALQIEQMQAKYLKDWGTTKGLIMSFTSFVLGTIAKTITNSDGYNTQSETSTNMPTLTQSGETIQDMPRVTQSTASTTGVGGGTSYTTVPTNYSQTWTDFTNQSYVAGTGQYGSNWGYYTRQTDARTTNTGYQTQSSNPYASNGMTGSVDILAHTIRSNTTNTTNGYQYTQTAQTEIPGQRSVAETETTGASMGVAEGHKIAWDGVDIVYTPHDTSPVVDAIRLGETIFSGYRNEMQSFMLGNLNDYLNRWASIQNDIHNGKVANLFKNITLLGTYNENNRLIGKYEIIIASLQPEDEFNFNLFLDHFGHAVDEYSSRLVTDVKENFNYTMVSEDAVLSNSVMPAANKRILDQFRAGVRVWKTLVRAENY
jgi:hypothetical protein